MVYVGSMVYPVGIKDAIKWGGGGVRRKLWVDEFETDVADKTCAKVNCSGH
jgi:hypothetical protein